MRQSAVVVLFILLLRIPFLHQAIQGDDVNYLGAAQYAQINPAHPTHYEFVFLGKKVSWRGHPHPPLNVWMQAGLLAWLGDIDEVRYHAAYIVFSLTAGFAMLSLARRFTAKPLTATLLLVAAPAFVVNGNSLESDVPFLAFWLASIALFVKAADSQSRTRLAAACLAMALAAMTAFQSVVMAPILAVYLWTTGSKWKPAWAALAIVPATLGAWQLFEKLTTQQLPAQVLAGYFSAYGLQSFANKLRNAAALTTHLGWILFPILTAAVFRRGFPLGLIAAAPAAWYLDTSPLFWFPFACGIQVLWWCWQHRREFLAAWVLIFFGASLALFFAGSARYLLPLAAPLALIAAERASRLFVWPSIALQLALGFALAKVNYDHWDAYRTIARNHQKEWDNRRVWINSELGFRFYAESAGAVPLESGQPVRPGDMVVTSKAAMPVSFTTGGGTLTPLATYPVTSSIPLRLYALGARSAYSVVSPGAYRAFDVGTQPIDIVEIASVTPRQPTLSFVPMIAPEAESQIVSGIDRVEDNRFRWMGKRGILLLKRPAAPAPVKVEFFLPDQAPGREVWLSLNGKEIARKRYLTPGAFTLESEPVAVNDDTATLAIEVDETFSVPGDQRVLGMIIVSAGFR